MNILLLWNIIAIRSAKRKRGKMRLHLPSCVCICNVSDQLCNDSEHHGSIVGAEARNAVNICIGLALRGENGLAVLCEIACGQNDIADINDTAAVCIAAQRDLRLLCGSGRCTDRRCGRFGRGRCFCHGRCHRRGLGRRLRCGTGAECHIEQIAGIRLCDRVCAGADLCGDNAVRSGELVAVEVQVGERGQRGERVGQILELVAHEIEVLERLHGEHLLRHGGQLPLREVELAEIGQVGEGALLERLRAAAQVEARHVGAVRGGESLERLLRADDGERRIDGVARSGVSAAETREEQVLGAFQPELFSYLGQRSKGHIATRCRALDEIEGLGVDTVQRADGCEGCGGEILVAGVACERVKVARRGQTAEEREQEVLVIGVAI